MAILVYTGTPATWPPVHSRSYYRTTFAGRNLARHYVRKHVPKSQAVPPAQLAYFGMQAAKFNRAYAALIMKWWKAGALPNGQAWWNALAAANAVNIYPGTTATLTGWRFFLWFQKVSLVATSWWIGPFEPNPQYPNPSPPPLSLDYPDYPRLPWSPPAPPSITSVTYISQTELQIHWDGPPLATPLSTSALAAKAQFLSPPATLWPHLAVTGRGAAGESAPNHWYTTINPTLIYPPRKTGQLLTITLRLFDTAARQPSDYAPPATFGY